MKKMRNLAFSGAVVLLGFVASAKATNIQFEGYAAPGNLVNVSPQAVYLEAGFTFTPTNQNSAVFDAAGPASFPGDATSFFGFDGTTNLITMTGPGVFDLGSFDIGPLNFAINRSLDATITADIFGGGTHTITFTGLTTDTTETVNWKNLTAVRFSSTDNTGVDNISTTITSGAPEPASVLLFSVGLGALAMLRRRREA